MGERRSLTILFSGIRAENQGLARVFAVMAGGGHFRFRMVIDDRTDSSVRSEFSKQNKEKEPRKEPHPLNILFVEPHFEILSSAY